MNLKQLNTIGSGPLFPINLSIVLKDDGTPEQVTLPDGSTVDKISWQSVYGDINLIKQNITAILTFQIGQRFREELFGSRTWECLEEPNTQALAFLIRDFIRDGISSWEPRVKAIDTTVIRKYDSVYIKLHFIVRGNQSVEELSFEYNPINNTTNAY